MPNAHFEFSMPALGADMDEGELVEWLVKPGDRVNKGDILAVVETTKGAIDIEVFQSGIIHELLVQPGQTIPVGELMARLEGIEEDSVDRGRISPLARRRAGELGIDLEQIKGTGPGSSIVVRDIDEAAGVAVDEPKIAAPVAPESTADARAAMRRGIAAAMSRSKREIPHYYLKHEVDLNEAVSWLESWNSTHGVTERLLPAVLLLKAVALAAAQFPEFNGWYRDQHYQAAESVNVSMAISLRGGGLVAPCLFDVANKDLGALMLEFKDLVKRARKGGLRGSELGMGSITLSSLGDRGVDVLTGIIYPPQVALVGVGSICERPWVQDKELLVRPTLCMTLSADHRVSDGHTGALFLRKINEFLQNPEVLA